MRESRPRYKLCEWCRRNEHKVAVRRQVKAVGLDLSRHTEVIGICPSCFANAFEPKPWKPDEIPVPFKGTTLVYDRRGTRSKAQRPIPDYMMPGYVEPEREPEAVEADPAANMKPGWEIGHFPDRQQTMYVEQKGGYIEITFGKDYEGWLRSERRKGEPIHIMRQRHVTDAEMTAETGYGS